VESKHLINFRQHRITIVIVGLVVIMGAIIAPFMSASCNTRQQTQGEVQALATLRAMTRNGVFPAEDAVARIETAYPNTKTAALARMLRARIKLNAKDLNGAVALLDSRIFHDRTDIGDYALLMRARALEQINRRPEARAAYEQIVSDYPTSIRAREATLRDAEMLLQENQLATAPTLLKALIDKDDAGALLLNAKATERAGDSRRALAAYRRIYFYAPASTESVEAASSIARLNSTLAPATPDEAIARADKLSHARRDADAYNAYTIAFQTFPNTADPSAQLQRGLAALNTRRFPEAIAAFNSIPTSAGDMRAEALAALAQTYAAAKQWPQARTMLDDLRRTSLSNLPSSEATSLNSIAARAFVKVGQMAQEAKNTIDAAYFFKAAVAAYPNAIEVAQAQFESAWLVHQTKNYAESSRLLIEHLALYADKNTDNRGRAGYWAARDSERAGKLAEAHALYEAMQGRYAANWYGYLSRQRLDVMARNGLRLRTDFAPDSQIMRAIANLQTVTVADETATANEDARILKADQLSNIGAEDWALEELNAAADAAPLSPRVNLAMARIYRFRDDNVVALNTLKKSYPDYSQMQPEELTREEWDVFYPLANWDTIAQESRLKNLDPYQVAGLIRQESVFNPRAHSGANAYGLMQLVLPTGRLTAKKYGVEREVTVETLYEPRLNIQLGTGYFRDQLDKFGRIEYVAAAYNAGPGRVPQWRATLPLELDEFVEAVPFKETRGYIQGVVRNMLQYKRLYDENGKFRPAVGTRAVHPASNESPNGAPAMGQPANSNVRPRRINQEHEEE
jgi:soluble lytic murein transglycosylase